MEEKYKNITINPTKHTYCFTYGQHDCYKLASGKCTFDLTEEEYLIESARCNARQTYEARVGYCRDILKEMNEDNAFTKSTGIWAYQRACGHIVFSDGQHRTCIAKKNNIESLFFDYLGQDDFLCSSCYAEKNNQKKKKSIWNFFKKDKEVTDGPIDITDEKLYS